MGRRDEMEAALMARPKKQQHESRTERLNLRFAPAELVQIEEQARLAGLSVTAYGRSVVLSPPTRALPAALGPLQDPALVIAMNRIGVNLNQIARGLNSGGALPPVYLIETLVRINALLDQVQT